MTKQLDADAVRRDFPTLARQVHGKPLVYLDTAATAMKPRSVIDAVTRYYEHDYATVRRGLYALSQEATALYEGTRERARAFFNARQKEEIVFVRGATEAVNLVAYTHGRKVLRAGDEVLVTTMEHHANIVPWQLVAAEREAKVVAAPITDRGEVELEAFERMLTPRTKIVAFTHMSNVLGTVNPVREMVRMARKVGATVLIDGAQSAMHVPVDVQAIDCDFFVCSGHKMLGPTGGGLLYGKHELLQAMPPWMGGGEMIHKVTFEGSTFDEPPYRFEAGTPPIASIIGLGAALEYIEKLGREAIGRHEEELARYTMQRLSERPAVRLIGTAPHKGGIVAFVCKDAHHFDLATLLDEQGIAIRVGHHCAQPLMRRYDVPGMGRVSFGPYSTKADVDVFVKALERALSILGA